jgi:hypothetical protein
MDALVAGRAQDGLERIDREPMTRKRTNRKKRRKEPAGWV